MHHVCEAVAKGACGGARDQAFTSAHYAAQTLLDGVRASATALELARVRVRACMRAHSCLRERNHMFAMVVTSSSCGIIMST
jgi:hypothetical protein